MNWGIVIVSVSGFIVLGLWIWMNGQKARYQQQLLEQKMNSMGESLSTAISTLSTTLSTNTSQELHQLQERLSQTLKNTGEGVETRIGKNTELFGKVQERLVKLEEASRQVQEVGKDISKLQDILRAPKLRGNLGELFLEEILAQILPKKNFEMQYHFKTGEIVDAVIKLADGYIVPIDAKFPLENFQKMLGEDISEEQSKQFRKLFGSDFKKHVDKIQARYIRPDEGTVDFALLYVPAENVYYEAILRDERFGENLGINQYALNKRVIPVSPNSMYAYLQAIVLGLRGLHIEEKAQKIFQFLTRLQSDFDKLKDDWGKVGKHISNARSAYEATDKRVGRIQEKLQSVEEQSALSESPSSSAKLNPAPDSAA